jgi:hypothetical protein
MAITLISENERLCCTIGDAQIWYRRVPSYIQRNIEQAHAKRGGADPRAVVEDVLAYALLEWQGVVDGEGQPVAYTPELLRVLPESVKADLVAKLYAATPEDVRTPSATC